MSYPFPKEDYRMLMKEPKEVEPNEIKVKTNGRVVGYA